MAHELFLNMDVRDAEVGSKDVVFLVYQDGEKFGELRVSKGSVVWRGAYDQYGRKLTWKRFDKVMQENARYSERRPPKARKTVSASKRK